MEVKRVAEKWKIWDKEEEAARSEEGAKKLVPKKFHRWIKVFGKKQSKQMPIRKIWDHTIDMKKGFAPRKGKVYPLSREETEEVREFIMANYKRELRMGGDIRRRGKVESAMELIERMKKVHKEARAMLKKVQEDMKK